MTLQLAPIPHLGCNLLFLEEVLETLHTHGIDQPILFRASEMDKLDTILAHGTDRAGYDSGRLWGQDPRTGSEILHEDVILATTEADIRRGEIEPDYSTSFKKFGLRQGPLLLIYEPRALVPLREKEYRFRDPTRKTDALLATIPVDLLPPIPGWFSAEEGLAYRRLAGHAMTGRSAPILVEVGSWEGRSTAWIARLCAARGAALFAVDHYDGSSDAYDPAYRVTLAERDVAAAFVERMAGIGADVGLLRQASCEAAATFTPGSVDLVFLDASHDAHAVADDLAAWWPRLRPGAILAGHDFNDDHPGVGAAVTAFAATIGRAVNRGPGSLWHIIR